MRHRKSGIKLNRTSSHREAMFRNMVTSLFKHDRIKTTDIKAKELRKWADHLITLAKRGDLHARRQALSIVREKNVVHKLFEEAVEKFGKSSGGYTRITKLGRRPGDAAPVSLIELIVAEKEMKKATKKSKPKPKAEKKAEKTVEKTVEKPVEPVAETIEEKPEDTESAVEAKEEISEDKVEAKAEEPAVEAKEEAPEDKVEAKAAEPAAEAEESTEDTPSDSEEEKKS